MVGKTFKGMTDDMLAWQTERFRELQTGESGHVVWVRPEQVVEMLVKGLEQDSFWIICPDDETTAEMDRKRVLWNALDIIKGRPALSRWHPDYKDAFAAFMQRDMPRDLLG